MSRVDAVTGLQSPAFSQCICTYMHGYEGRRATRSELVTQDACADATRP